MGLFNHHKHVRCNFSISFTVEYILDAYKKHTFKNQSSTRKLQRPKYRTDSNKRWCGTPVLYLITGFSSVSSFIHHKGLFTFLWAFMNFSRNTFSPSTEPDRLANTAHQFVLIPYYIAHLLLRSSVCFRAFRSFPRHYGLCVIIIQTNIIHMRYLRF